MKMQIRFLDTGLKSAFLCPTSKGELSVKPFLSKNTHKKKTGSSWKDQSGQKQVLLPPIWPQEQETKDTAIS